ncbi:MAG: hypothetical protein LBT48_06095 [Prevotellaceae bacterium]|nr:hypothetical protein [Prevotellaceae bacterium]
MNTQNLSIFPKGNKAPADWFTGTVWVQPLVNPDEMENLYAVGSVTFEAGARTHWHGASHDSRFVHIAITNMANGNNVTWMLPVTDEEYKSVNK